MEPAAGEETRPGGSLGRWPSRVLVAIVALSLAPRFIHLDVPPLDLHDFRQTQTAITVQAFLEHGIQILRYETPIFGPPWTVPFEFPLFQLLAFAVARLGLLNVDLACRLTAVLCFYLSAWMLFVVVRRWGNSRLAVAALALYVLSPFSVIWSRAVLIDYASVALALGYLHTALLWAVDRRRGAWIWAVLLGALGFLTKITTLVTVAVPIALALGWRLRRTWETTRAQGVSGSSLGDVLAAGAIAVIPFVSGLLWTRWADAIKASQVATASLTSTALTAWNFGTWGQRFDPGHWLTILGRVASTILPGAFFLTVPLAAFFFARSDRRLRVVVLVAAAGASLPVWVFFNLYWVHDYYLIAITPFLAVLGAAGLSYLLDLRLTHRRRWVAFVVAVVSVTTLPFFLYVRPTYEVSRASPVARLGSLVARTTQPDEWVVVQGDDWNSRILYSARRRGFMIWDGHTDVKPLATRSEFGALVCQECPPELLALFPRRSLVGHEASWDVYRLSPEGADPREVPPKPMP